MFWNNKQTQENLYKFFRKLFGFDKNTQLYEVDFEKPWWDLLLQQKKVLLINIFNILQFSLVASLAPFALAQAFSSRNIQYFLILILVLVGFRVLNMFLFYYEPILRLQSSKSIENSAAKFFLRVDPINHSLRSSGQVVAKVNRGSGSFESILDILSYDILNVLGLILGTLIAFAQIDLFLTLELIVFITLVISINIFLFVSRTKLFKRFRIKSDDKAKAVALETLQQTSFIRAVFGTKEQFSRVSNLQNESMVANATIWRMGALIVTSSQLVFIASLGIIGYQLLVLPGLDMSISLALILSYFQLGNRINFVGHGFGRLINCLEDINDLWDFIRGFGKQTYPVLESEKLIT